MVLGVLGSASLNSFHLVFRLNPINGGLRAALDDSHGAACAAGTGAVLKH